MRLIVISDVHVGSGPLDDFDEELEQGFVDFLGQLAADTTPTLLVINGDFLDFAQAEPWQSHDLESHTDDGVPLCFTEEQSVAKLQSIVRAHEAAFAALGRLMHNPYGHRVVILPGNHDADFFWPRVRAEFELAVGHGSQDNQRLRFHLEQAYCPGDFPGVWIEHGHQHDACNRFSLGGTLLWSEKTPPIRQDHAGVPRLLECVGTRFLIGFLNALDAEYPFVDNVKPFSKFVRMFLASTVHRDFGPIKASIAYWGFVRFFATSLRTSPRILLDADRGLSATLRQLKDRLTAMRRSSKDRLVHALTRSDFSFKGMPFDFYVADEGRLTTLLDFLCTKSALLNAFEDEPPGLLSAAAAGYLTLGGGYLADETAALKTAARDLIRRACATTVVMGHTHEPVLPDADLNYVNVGCWTRYLRGAAEQRKQWSWRLLKSDMYENFPFELAYAEVPQKDPTAVARRLFRR
jgi:UDP-2,3-diacylglucosamine pyrophosphatase LpxH